MIARGGRREIEIRKSRFICTASRVSSEEEARAFVESVRKEFWDASHNCVAWVIGENGRFQRSNDDGEPAGTAGTPMLEVLRRRGVTDTAVVVTRYFGGIMLGAGGLIRAYGQSVSNAVSSIGIVERETHACVSVHVAHSDAGRFEHAIRSTSFHLTDVTYDGARVTLLLTLEPGRRYELDAWVAQQSNGQATVVSGSDVFVEIPVRSDHE